VIRPNQPFQVYVAEKTAANLVVAAHRHPHPHLTKRITMGKFGNPFSTACYVWVEEDQILQSPNLPRLHDTVAMHEQAIPLLSVLRMRPH
jgi:hypothetical protein